MKAILALWAGLLAPSDYPVTGLSVLPNLEKTEIIVTVDGAFEYRDFTMEGPNRLILDFMGARHALPNEQFPGISRGGVRAIRSTQYSDDIVRVVIELESMVDYSVLRGDGHLRVTLDNPGPSFDPWEVVSDPFTVLAATTGEPAAVAEPVQQEPLISIGFSNTPIDEVLFFFAEFANRSIVSGADVDGTVSADIRDQPWDEALREILEVQDLVAVESESGIIRVQTIDSLDERETKEQLLTVTYPISFGTATEYETAVQTLLTERGGVSIGQSSNALIVTDIQRVQSAVANLIAELDVRTPQVNIAAEIVFVDRTDLNEFGITYDLKDSQGNQLNLLTAGSADLNGDGIAEEVPQGTNVIGLGGNSVAALGNARQRVAGPSLTLLSSLVIGRHTLVSFIDALKSVNLSEVHAAPSVTVINNQPAKVLVGEETPLRVIDTGTSTAGAGGGAGGGAGANQQGGGLALPQATVELKETGILLEATPHVTAGDNILLEVRAERSSAELAPSDVGFIFRTQETESRILVRDGQTVMVAGLTVTEKAEARTGIPLMMDLPVMGRLFQVNREQTIQRDLIIMITPTIVRDGAN